MRGLRMIAEGDSAGAIPVVRSAAEGVRRDPFLERFAERVEGDATRLLSRGDVDSALSRYRFLVDVFPKLASARYGLGYCYEQKKDIVRAYVQYTEAVALDPDSARNQLAYASVSFKAGNWQATVSGYHRALQVDPGNVNAIYNLSRVLVTAPEPYHDVDAAVALAKQACELTKWKEKGMVANLMWVYGKSGHTAEANALAERLKEMR